MKMPDILSAIDFIAETRDDLSSPTTSSFPEKMPSIRHTATILEDEVDMDRGILQKLKKAVKSLHTTGIGHYNNDLAISENLCKIGESVVIRESEAEIASAFIKFSAMNKDFAAHFRNMIQSMNNIITFPLETLLKGDLKGDKGDLKKNFDKASKDYDNKLNKLEKEKKQMARDAGFFRTDITGGEVAEEMERERRLFQLHMCEYLIKVNEIKTKRGVELLQHFIEYFKVQQSYFQSGVKIISQCETSIDELQSRLQQIKIRQHEERLQLTELNNLLKSTMNTDQQLQQQQQHHEISQCLPQAYSLHQPQGNKMYGSEKKGYLYKRSDGLRKVWQKRQCTVERGYLILARSSKLPVKLNLLTCSVKGVTSGDDNNTCFNIIPGSGVNRTYHFQAESETDREAWVSVIANSKQEAFQAFGDSSQPQSQNSSLRELTHNIITEITKLPGNAVCCDCSAPGPEWLSTNLGILMCIECSGIHRELGVHLSRTRSLTLDHLGTAELLVARVIGNRSFNSVMEQSLSVKDKPTPECDMAARKEFIKAKYELHRYAGSGMINGNMLVEAVTTCDMLVLLEGLASGLNVNSDTPDGSTLLHLAIQQQNINNLPMVEFIIQNSNRIDAPSRNYGDTALHCAVKNNNSEIIKLLFRAGASTTATNSDGFTPLTIATDMNHTNCEELLKLMEAGKLEQCENVIMDWNLSQDGFEDGNDFSDDDLDEMTPDKRQSKLRPVSIFQSANQNRKSCSLPRNVVLSTIAGGGVIEDTAVVEETLSVETPPIIPPHKQPQQQQQQQRQPHRRVGSEYKLKRSVPPHTSLITDRKPVAASPTQDIQPSLPSNDPKAKSDERSHSKSIPSTPDKDWRPPLPPKRRQLSKSSPMIANTDELLDTPPALLPKKSSMPKVKVKRVRALYDCSADYDDELSFTEGDTIIVTAETNDEWWTGYIDGCTEVSGLFPVSFVHMISGTSD